MARFAQRMPGVRDEKVQWSKADGAYGRYVTVNESAGRALFYVFAEAEEDSSSLPLVLWLKCAPRASLMLIFTCVHVKATYSLSACP